MTLRFSSGLLLSCLCLPFSSCATGGDSTPNAGAVALGGVAAATAFAAAIPLMPLVGAYEKINRSEEKYKRKNEELWRPLDPILIEKTNRLKKRDPKADARRAWKTGARAYISNNAKAAVYDGIGINNLADSGVVKKVAANQRIIAGNPFLSGIQKQLQDRPQAPEGSRSPSDASFHFDEASTDYQIAFNTEMKRLRKGR